MSTSIAATSSATSDYSTQDAVPVATKTLGQDDFLKLLVAQLSTQDPLNPTKDTDFIAQMAQFSSLEQTKGMQTQLTSLQQDQKFSAGQQLIGQTVELQGADKTTTSGVVTAMRVEDGTPKIEVNGTLYGLEQVLSVTVTPTNP